MPGPDEHVEHGEPLELLERLCRQACYTFGILSTARGPRRDTESVILCVEVRAGFGPWTRRDLVARRLISPTHDPAVDAPRSIREAALLVAEDLTRRAISGA